MAVARERWATKIGLVLALAGNAIGRMGGRHGRGHTAGMFELMWRRAAMEDAA